jgi:hypothetical protein
MGLVLIERLHFNPLRMITRSRRVGAEPVPCQGLSATKKATPVMDCTKPEPLYTMPSLGTVCPVCGKKSYSAAGIHPQCAVKQADAPREAALAVQRKEKRAEDVANRHAGIVDKAVKKPR